MIYKVEMYAGCCDNCKREVLENAEYSALGDESLIKDEMLESGWIHDKGKDYCDYCWCYDDNDSVIINKERTKTI